MTAGLSPGALRVAALLVAGGRGERVGGALPKQFQRLEGRMLLAYGLETLAASPLVETIVVVVPQGWEEHLRSALAEERSLSRVQSIVAGGSTRQESVWCGLQALGPCTHVLVHDAARPFLTQGLIAGTLEAARRSGAATAALPVLDTLMRTEERAPEPGGAPRRVARGGVDRDDVWAVQTPQAFELSLLREAHLEARRRRQVQATDDTSLVLALGRPVEFVRGGWWNIKVTDPEDLERARGILRARAWAGQEGPTQPRQPSLREGER